MADEAKDQSTNQDTQTNGDQSPSSEGAQDTKMVPERDLMALKSKAEGLETRLGEATSELETWKGNAAKLQDALRRAEAARDEAIAAGGSLEEITTERDRLRQELGEAQTAVRETNERLLSAKRENIAVTFNVDPAALEGKTTAELDTMAEAFKLIGAKGRTYAGGAGGGSGDAPLTPRQKMIQGFSQR